MTSLFTQRFSSPTGAARVSLTALLLAVATTGVTVGLAVWLSVRQTATTPAASSADATAAAGHDDDLPPGIVELSTAAQQNAGLATMRAATRLLPAAISLTGAVAPDEAQVAHVRPLARGLIEKVWVRLGDRVTRGQPLVTYDNIELGELVGQYLGASAALQQARTELDVRSKALDRARELIRLEAIARQTLDLREAEVRNAEAAVASARASVSRIEEQIHRFGFSDAALERLTAADGGAGPHREASHSVLRAPIDGIVTKFDVAQGEVVELQRELFTISDLSSVWVLADVYEKDLAKLRAGSEVRVRVDAYPDRTFTGTVTYISDLIDPSTRSAKVRCVVANPDRALKLDMFARVIIPTTDRRDALTLPTAAVQQVDGQSIVFVRQSPTRFARRDVQLGAASGDQLEVLRGVAVDDEVVTSGSFYLKTALQRDRISDDH